MAWIDEQLSAQFHEWERRGRGWQVWSAPVAPEPPFKPFPGHYLPQAPLIDDGRRPTALSSFVSRLRQKLNSTPPPLPPEEAQEEEPEPELLERGELVELRASLPEKLDASREVFAHFLATLAYCKEPVGFELLGLPDTILNQFVVNTTDLPSIQRQLQAHFPEAVFIKKPGVLAEAWRSTDDLETAVVEFGLAREFMFPLATNDYDALVGLTAALAELQAGELGLFQVLFQHVRHGWAESLLRSVADGEGKPAFINAPELLEFGERKVSQPLFAVVVRIAARSETFDRTWAIARDMASALGALSDVRGNELIPLSNDNYPRGLHAEDVWRRQTHRSGMILNQDELLAFVHLPSTAVRTTKLQRELRKTKRAPKLAENARGLLLGCNEHAGLPLSVRLTPEQRVRHLHVIGASGTGKSTFLFNLIRQDIENGEGLAVLDPHGDLVESILGIIPPHRVNDVVLVDPSDEGFSVGFNILSAHSDLEKNILASDLVSVFERLSTSWGDQMASVLNNAIRAFLESSQGGTLADLRRFLVEPDYRAQFLRTVQDLELVYYWQKAFPQLSGNKSIGPILTRLETFLSPKPIRYMVSQRQNSLDFSAIMNGRKIFLAKLAQGTVGKENSYLLGTLLVAKLQQLAMSRQNMRESERRDFWCYIDEFHNFITPSMAEILTGARKYRLGLILAHQELRQLQRDAEVASAVLSNTYTRVVFRVGDADARVLESGFTAFEARDLQNLGIGEAVARIERSEFDFNISIPRPAESDEATTRGRRDEVVAASRAKYAVARAHIETSLRQAWEAEQSTPPPGPQPRPKPTVSEKETPIEATPVAPIAAEPPAKQAQIETPKPAPPPADMGRGGAQHKAIQHRLKSAAEELGFQATIEKEIPNGSVDLLLEKVPIVIACEISVTTTIDHEVGNVQKCLRAGFFQVAIICQEEARLQKIASAIATSLGTEAAGHVAYFQPDQFIANLRELAEQAEPVTPSETTVIRRGRKVTRKFSDLSEAERKAREETAMKQMAEMMKKRPATD